VNDLEAVFPRLRASGHRVTSDATPTYNCIAWAAGHEDAWWWPEQGGYWPDAVPREPTIAAFVAALGKLGYEPCAMPAGPLEIEASDFVALFVDESGLVTHAARWLGRDRWTSKLGSDVDIEHGHTGLEGDVYGRVAQLLSRRRQ